MMLINLIGLVLKNYIEILFFNIFLTNKSKHFPPIFFFHITLINLVFILAFEYINQHLIIKLISSLIVLLSFWLYYDNKIATKAIYTVVLVVLIVISELLPGLVLLTWNISLTLLDYNQILIFQQVNQVIILFALCMIIKVLHNKDIHIKKGLLLSIYPLTSIIVLYSFYLIIIYKINNQTSYIIFLLVLCLLLLSNLTIVYIIKETVKVELYVQKVKYLNEFTSVNKHHQDDLTRLYRDIRKVHHDLKASYIHLLGLLNSKKYIECKMILENSLEEVENFESVINTGYDGFDAVISSKIMAAKTNKIQLIPTILLPSKKFININELDISIICANILDNAIEAKNYYFDDDYIIYFKIVYNTVLSSLIIQCKNPTSFLAPRKYTKKSDPINHGFGLANVKEISKKWHGLVHTTVKDGFYNITITLSNKS